VGDLCRHEGNSDRGVLAREDGDVVNFNIVDRIPGIIIKIKIK